MSRRKIVGPISPDDVQPKKTKSIPQIVFDAFNELIKKKYSNGSAFIQKGDVVALIVMKGIARKDIFENHWLDIQDDYQRVGWKVEYDKPGCNETGPSTFTFSKSLRDM